MAGGQNIEFEGQFRLPLSDVRQAWDSGLLV